MAAERLSWPWQAVGRSVRGASHERAGAPNQDAVHWLPESGAGLPLILTVADGHGSAKYFRSDTGARLAVETSAQVVQNFLKSQAHDENLSVIKRSAEEWLPKAIVRGWVEAVEQHARQHPLPDIGPEVLEERHHLKHFEGQDLLLAYGATVLVAAVAESFILYLQLGDGDILSVSDAGRVSRPLMKDERLFANETTSLCAPDAWRDFRVCFQAITDTPPALVILSTDGYANSFRDEAGFLQVGTDLLEIIRADGLSRVEESLATWLSESTRAGSGDDATLGLICRVDVAQTSAERVFQAQISDDERARAFEKFEEAATFDECRVKE